MILGDTPQTLPPGDPRRTTLDDLFRRAAVRQPHAIALADRSDCKPFPGGAPCTLTYLEVDNAVSAIAAQLRSLGLPPDAVVAYQLPNTIESVLMLLGVLRAGMIAAPLPLLWSAAEIVAALARVNAPIIVTSSSRAPADYCAVAMQAAADHFPIRHVCAFGTNLPDGVVPLDDVFTADAAPSFPGVNRSGNPAAHVALVTWEIGPQGLLPIGRNHRQILAGADSLLCEVDFRGAILSAIPPTTFAGIALGVVPWLHAGSRLVLHDAFDAEALVQQRFDHGCDRVVLPGAIIPRLCEAGYLKQTNGLRAIYAVWRSPEQRLTSPACGVDATIVDILALGELGLLTLPRGTDGRPAPGTFAPIPASAGGDSPAIEIQRARTGTLSLRGRMVPDAAFPPGAERGLFPFLKIAADHFVDSGYPCYADGNGSVHITGPIPGMVSVGGYRFRLHDIEMQAAAARVHVTLAALPNALTGHRLAGTAVHGTVAEIEFAAANPLIAAAFHDELA